MKGKFIRSGESKLIKCLSLILAQCFLFYSICYGTIERQAPPDSKVPQELLTPEAVGLSKNIGTIKSKYQGKNGKLIIHIQDAHCNYEAQTNIAKILEHLIKQYNINLVAVEGADGIVDTSWFKAFPDAEIRKEVADYFMKKGEITGTEFLSITSDYPFTIYGVEDRNYYIKNLNSFLESYPYKDEFVKYYENVKQALGKLKKYIYSKELAGIDRNITRHKEKEIEFADYVKYLKTIAESKKIKIRDFKNFNTLTETLRYEKDINFDVVNEERAQLIDVLSKKLSKDRLSELVNKSLEFKLGKIDNTGFYSYLAKLAKENKISLPKEYNNLSRYIIYTRIYSRIDHEELFDEIDLLLYAIKDKMFKNDDQRILDGLWKNVNIILGFIKIELSNKEYDYYLANKDNFAPDKFLDFIRQQSSRYGLAYEVAELPSEISYVFPKLIDFYEIALKRDRILVKNMFKGMRGQKTDAAVLITGGFHTKGISKVLEEEDVSYVVVSPVITKEAESPYISVLTGQKTPFEELLIETENKGGLQFASRLCSMCQDRRITGDSIEEAGRHFLDEVARFLVLSYVSDPHYRNKDPRDIRKAIFERLRAVAQTVQYRQGSERIAAFVKVKFDELYQAATAELEQSGDEPVQFGDEPLVGQTRLPRGYQAAYGRKLLARARRNVQSDGPAYGVDLGNIGGGVRARNFDDIAQKVARKTGAPVLHIIHHCPDSEILIRNGGLPTCQIRPTRGGRLVMQIHGRFDGDMEDIGQNNLEFTHTVTTASGKKKTRTINVAQSIAFKLNLHEMWWRKRKPGHAYMEGGRLKIDREEAGKHEAARIEDDACLLWYYAAYMAKDPSIRYDADRLARYMRKIIESSLGRRAFPRLYERDGQGRLRVRLAEQLIGIALLVNQYYYIEREDSLTPRPNTVFRPSVYSRQRLSRRQLVAAYDIPLTPEEQALPEEELVTVLFNTRRLPDIQSLISDPHMPSNVRNAAGEAEKRVLKARIVAFGDETHTSEIFKQQDLRSNDADKDLPYDVIYDIALAILRETRRQICDFEAGDILHPTIVLGNDVRDTSPRIRKAVEDALKAHGVRVVYIGEMHRPEDGLTYNTTPMASWAYRAYEDAEVPIHATIMITGSHLRGRANGIKITVLQKDLAGNPLRDLLQVARNRSFYDNQITQAPALPEGEAFIARNGLTDYKEFLRQDLRDIATLLKGKKIVVDAHNGAGGFYADVLSGFDGIEVVKLHCNPDGAFPHGEANPTLPSNRIDAVRAVRQNRADLAILFDSDCDRVIFLDSNGNTVDGQKLLQLLSISEIAKVRKAGGDPANLVIVGNNKTSMAAIDAIEDEGAIFAMANTGYVYCRELGIELNGADTATLEQYLGAELPYTERPVRVLIAGEESGHIMFGDNEFIDDGMMTANRVLRAIFAHFRKPLARITADFPDYIIQETRQQMSGTFEEMDTSKEVIPQEIESYAQALKGVDVFAIEENPRAGTRLTWETARGDRRAWVLFRASLTDPEVGVMLEGKTLASAIKAAKEACKILVTLHQDSIDPRRIIAFKQGLQIGDSILRAASGGLRGNKVKIATLMRGIFAPMAKSGEDKILYDVDHEKPKLKLDESDNLADPLLVWYRMNAVRQALVKSGARQELLYFYYDSLVNQFIDFIKRGRIDINWHSANLSKDNKKARGFLTSELDEAENFLKPIRERKEQQKTLKALSVLFGKDAVQTQITACNGDAGRAIREMLLGAVDTKDEATEGKIPRGASLTRRNSLRRIVNGFFRGEDLISAQRMVQSSDPEERKKQQKTAEDRALKYLRVVSIKLAEELGCKLTEVENKELGGLFTRKFGLILMSLGGGYGNRYSYLIHKAFGTPFFTGMTNARLSLLFGTMVDATGYQYGQTCSQSDFSVMGFLSDWMKRCLRLGIMRMEGGQLDIRPANLGKNIPIAEMRENPETGKLEPTFGPNAARGYPPQIVHVGQRVHGYGGGFLGQIFLTRDLQEEGKIPDAPYYARYEQEHPTHWDERTSNLILVTYMEAVIKDSDVEIGLKESTVLSDKGSPRDPYMEFGTIRHLQHFRNKDQTDKARGYYALLMDPRTGKPKTPEAEEFLQRIADGELGDEDTAPQLIAEIEGDLGPQHRFTVANDSNTTVVHRRIAEPIESMFVGDKILTTKKIPAGNTILLNKRRYQLSRDREGKPVATIAGKRYRVVWFDTEIKGPLTFANPEVIMQHPDCQGQVDDKKGIAELTPNDPVLLLFDHYAELRPGERPPVGCVVVPNGPDHIKTTWKQTDFNQTWQQLLRKILKKHGISITNLDCFTIHCGPHVSRMRPKDIEEAFFGENGVFINPTTGKPCKDVSLVGRVHIDLTSRLSDNVTIRNSDIRGWCYVNKGCTIDDSMIVGNSERNPRLIGGGSTVTDCLLVGEDNIPLNSRLERVTELPDATKDARRAERAVLNRVYEKSSREMPVSDELTEVLAGTREVISSLESFLLQEPKTGSDILRDIARLRKNTLQLDADEKKQIIDLARGDEPQYVLRQVIANMGLFTDLWDEDPAVVGQVLTFPKMPGSLSMLKYRGKKYKKGISEVTQAVVHELVSVFGSRWYDKDKKKQVLRRIDQIYALSFDINNEFTRIQNGTYVDGLRTHGRFYQGVNWGVVDTIVHGNEGENPAKDSVVVLADHQLYMDGPAFNSALINAFEPPDGTLPNSATLMIRCQFGKRNAPCRAFIGAGAGEWQVKHRGRVLEDVTFEGPFVVVEEGEDLPRGSVVSGISDAAERTADKLASGNDREAYKTMWALLADRSREYGINPAVDKANLGRFTRVATALCLLVQRGERARALNLLDLLNKEIKEGKNKERVREVEVLKESLLNKLYIISSIMDPENLFKGWVLQDGLNSRAPPTPKPNYADLKDAVSQKQAGYKALYETVRECAKHNINPQLLTVQRPYIGNTGERSKVYRDKMAALREFKSPDKLGMAIERYCVLKDPETIRLILEAYKAYVLLKQDRTLVGKEKSSRRKALDRVKKELQNNCRLKRIRKVTDESVVSLYVAIFGPYDYIGLPKDGIFEYLVFRGGRGAKWFLSVLQAMLEKMGVLGKKLIQTMLPGATDDGRSWLFCSLLFKAPGMPDIGKCSMDIAQDKKLKGILGDTRFDNIAKLRQFVSTMQGDGNFGPAVSLQKYVLENNKVNVSKAITHFVGLFLRELRKVRNEMPPKEAREILIHVLNALREGTLQSGKKEAKKAWRDFARNISKYLRESDSSAVKKHADLIADVIGQRDSRGNLREEKSGCLLRGLDIPDIENRQKLLEGELNDALLELEKQGDSGQQALRELLYAAFCANMEIPEFGIPLRSVVLVGAHIYFEGTRESNESGLQLGIDGDTINLVDRETDRYLSEKIKELEGYLRAKGQVKSMHSDIAWYLTIKVFEKFLDTQGTVKPATLRRYHLTGVCVKFNKAGDIEQIQVLGSEDAYNEVPKIGDYYVTFLRERPLLDVDEKHELRKAIEKKDLQKVIEILKPTYGIASNPEAIEAIKKAKVILMFPTTLISNIASALLAPLIGEAVVGNEDALKAYIHNALFENDPPGTTAATMMEELYRLITRQQRHDEAHKKKPLDWAQIAKVFTYMLLRKPCLFEAYEGNYIPTDEESIRDRVGDALSMLALDSEDPRMSAKGKYLAGPIIRAILQLYQLKNLGLLVTSDGNLRAFPGVAASDIRPLEDSVATEWDTMEGLEEPVCFGDDPIPEEDPQAYNEYIRNPAYLHIVETRLRTINAPGESINQILALLRNGLEDREDHWFYTRLVRLLQIRDLRQPEDHLVYYGGAPFTKDNRRLERLINSVTPVYLYDQDGTLEVPDSSQKPDTAERLARLIALGRRTGVLSARALTELNLTIDKEEGVPMELYSRLRGALIRRMKTEGWGINAELVADDLLCDLYALFLDTGATMLLPKRGAVTQNELVIEPDFQRGISSAIVYALKSALLSFGAYAGNADLFWAVIGGRKRMAEAGFREAYEGAEPKLYPYFMEIPEDHPLRQKFGPQVITKLLWRPFGDTSSPAFSGPVAKPKRDTPEYDALLEARKSLKFFLMDAFRKLKDRGALDEYTLIPVIAGRSAVDINYTIEGETIQKDRPAQYLSELGHTEIHFFGNEVVAEGNDLAVAMRLTENPIPGLHVYAADPKKPTVEQIGRLPCLARVTYIGGENVGIAKYLDEKLLPALESQFDEPVQFADEALPEEDTPVTAGFREGHPMTFEQIVSAIVKDRNPLRAAQNMFPREHAQFANEERLTAVINDLLNAQTQDTSLAPVIWQFISYSLAEIRELELEPAHSQALYAIAGQAFNILSFREDRAPGAENMRLTVNPDEMLTSSHSTKVPSFLRIQGLPVGFTDTEGQPDAFHRGAETPKKMGSQISGLCAYNKARLAFARFHSLLYIMLHGIIAVPRAILQMTREGRISTYHITTFVTGVLNGSSQCASTGPGHFQISANNKPCIDLKEIPHGKGIQWIKFYDENGKLQGPVLAIRLDAKGIEGSRFAMSLPGTVDSFENLGGLDVTSFRDVSIEVSEMAVQHMYDVLGLQLDYAKIHAAEVESGAIKAAAAKDFPYFVEWSQGEPKLAKTRSDAPPVIWVNGLNPEIFGNQSLLDFYRNLDENGALQAAHDAFGYVFNLQAWAENAPSLPEETISMSPSPVTPETLEHQQALKYLHHVVNKGAPFYVGPYISTGGTHKKTWGKPLPESNILSHAGYNTPEEKLEGLAKFLEISGTKDHRTYYDQPTPNGSELRARLNEADAIVAERWFASGLIGCGVRKVVAAVAEVARRLRKESEIVLRVRKGLEQAVLSIPGFAEKIFGREHIELYGPRAEITAKELDAAKPLSLQIHNFPEAVYSLGEGYIWVGLREDLGPTPEARKARFIDEMRRGTNVPNLLNRVKLEPGDVYIVPTGTMHCYGGKEDTPAGETQFLGVDVYEIKPVIDGPDKTVSFFDRLPRTTAELRRVDEILRAYSPQQATEVIMREKLARPGKDFVTMVKADGTINEEKIQRITDHAENSGSLLGLDPEDIKFQPFPAAEEYRGKETTCQVIAIMQGLVVLQYGIEFEKSIPCEALLADDHAYHVLYVHEGKVQIVDEKGEVVAIPGKDGVARKVLSQGDEAVIYHDLFKRIGRYTIKAVDVSEESQKAVVFTQYKPLRSYAMVTTAHDAVKANLTKIQTGLGVRLLTEQRVFADGDTRTPGSIGYERRVLRHISQGRVELVGWSTIQGLVDTVRTSEKSVVNVIQVTKTTADKLKAIAESPVHTRPQLRMEVRRMLENTRIMILPDLPTEPQRRRRGLPFIREIESAGVLLGNTSEQDIAQQTSIAHDLRSLMMRLTGNAELSWENMRALITADAQNIDQRWNILINALLVTMPAAAYDAEARVRARRELQWSL